MSDIDQKLLLSINLRERVQGYIERNESEELTDMEKDLIEIVKTCLIVLKGQEETIREKTLQ